MTAGIVLIFAGYSIGSYGVILIKGWNVPWRAWIDPIHPWQWPAKGNVPKIPSTRVLPAAVKVKGGSTA